MAEDPDPKDINSAAVRYATLRGNYWRSSLGVLITFAVVLLLLAAFGPAEGSPALGILVTVSAIGALICWILNAVCWLMLLNFRCPHCGNRFILTWSSSWPGSSCKHCGLNLASFKRAKAKPTPLDNDA
jgi:hypothetical protein